MRRRGIPKHIYIYCCVVQVCIIYRVKHTHTRTHWNTPHSIIFKITRYYYHNVSYSLTFFFFCTLHYTLCVSKKNYRAHTTQYNMQSIVVNTSIFILIRVVYHYSRESVSARARLCAHNITMS